MEKNFKLLEYLNKLPTVEWPNMYKNVPSFNASHTNAKPLCCKCRNHGDL